MRWMWEAKVARMTRPGAAANRGASAGPTSDSDGVCPGRSTLVESEQRASTPCSPSSVNRA